MDAPQPRRLEGGDALVASLSRHGVKSLFSVSGGPINSVYHATTRSDVRLVHTRHEAAAGFMADSVYRATGVPGVLLTTLGPAVTNAVTPAATALVAGVPMLIVGGQTATANLHRGAGMELDTMSSMQPVTKWAAQVLDANRIPEFVDEAWRRMLAGTPGPVYLEIPEDVLSAPVEDAKSRPWPKPSPAQPAADAVAQVRELLAGARRPILLAGDGVFHSGATAQLREFVAQHEIPVHTLRLARGAIDETSDPWWSGAGYVPANPVLRDSLQTADLVLLLGHHWEFDLGFGFGVANSVTVVQVHHDAAFIGRNGRVDVGIVSDSGAFLAALGTVEARSRDEAWIRSRPQQWRAHTEELTAQSQQEDPTDGRLHPLAVVDAVTAACPAGTRFVTSHGNVDFWADPRIEVREPGTYLRAGQSGALGAEVPYGVGTAVEDPAAATVVIVGDGGVGYHATELETAARFGARTIVIVLDDNSWGAIAMPQRRAYEVEVALALPERDWAAVGAALGGTGAKASTPEEIGARVTEALAGRGPAIIQVPIRPVLSPYMDFIS